MLSLSLGANAQSVLALMLKRTMWPVVVGAAALFVVGVASAAAVLAARPATRSDPLIALRYE
jgi:ABC-type antimicrobial peptide transport system permease subunit